MNDDRPMMPDETSAGAMCAMTEKVDMSDVLGGYPCRICGAHVIGMCSDDFTSDGADRHDEQLCEIEHLRKEVVRLRDEIRSFYVAHGRCGDGYDGSTIFDDERDQWLRETIFCVEADGFASLKLWEEWHERMKWEQLNPGSVVTVGHLDGRPVTVCMFWWRIDGRIVMFWHSSSQVVDHKQIEHWFDACAPTYDRGKRRARCDAMNFFHCVQAIHELNGEV